MKRAFVGALCLLCAGMTGCGEVKDTELPRETSSILTTVPSGESLPESITETQSSAVTQTTRSTQTSRETLKETVTSKKTQTGTEKPAETEQGTVTEPAQTQETQPVTEEQTTVQTLTPETRTALTTAMTTTENASQEPPHQSRSLGRFSDYTDWSREGYDQGTLVAQGSSGINEDHYRTLPGTEAYRSGRIVVGDSRCCQMGIFEQVSGRSDYAVFAVWGGHLTPGVGYQILSDGNLSEIRACFEEQVRSAGDCTIYLFATVNDYDYARGNNAANIAAVTEAAKTLSALTTQMEGKTVSPRVKVVGFDGCWDYSDLYGIPQEDFNRYINAFSDSLRDKLSDAGFTEYTTVMDIVGGKAGFIDDGLHYDEDTLEKLSDHVIA